jgi:hypothetical protein
MKYFYSMLIIMVAYFALPPVLDFSGHMADHLRQMGKDKDIDENSPDMYLKKIQQHESLAKGALNKPTAIKETKE